MYKPPIIKPKLSKNQQSMLNLMRFVKGENIPLKQAAKKFYEYRYPKGVQQHVCDQMRAKAACHKGITNSAGNLKKEYFLHCIGSTDYVVLNWDCKKVRQQITKWNSVNAFTPTGEYEEYYSLYLEGYWLFEPSCKIKEVTTCKAHTKQNKICTLKPSENGYCHIHKDCRIWKRPVKIPIWEQYTESKYPRTHAGLHPKWLNDDGSQMTIAERKAKYVDCCTSDDWPNPKLIGKYKVESSGIKVHPFKVMYDGNPFLYELKENAEKFCETLNNKKRSNKNRNSRRRN